MSKHIYKCPECQGATMIPGHTAVGGNTVATLDPCPMCHTKGVIETEDAVTVSNLHVGVLAVVLVSSILGLAMFVWQATQ